MADEKDRAPAAVPASSAEPRAESASSADPRAEGLSSAEPRAESASSAAPHAVPASSAAARAGRPGVPKATNAHVRKSMQGNKGKDTKPELLVRRRLREAGLVGYRLQWKKAPGRPDVAWPGKKVALFVNGCFWHRCPHCQPRSPKTHSEYWQEKFRRNQERDRRNQELLELDGWHVHVVWECQLKKGVVDRTFAELLPRLAQELGREERYMLGESLEAQGAAVEAPVEAHEPQRESPEARDRAGELRVEPPEVQDALTGAQGDLREAQGGAKQIKAGPVEAQAEPREPQEPALAGADAGAAAPPTR